MIKKMQYIQKIDYSASQRNKREKEILPFVTIWRDLKNIMLSEITAWLFLYQFSSVQFISVAQSCLTLCDPMNRSTPGLPVHHQLLEFTQTHVHRVSDAIQPSHPLSSPSPPAPNPSQRQSFPMSQLYAWGGQSTGVSASASFLPKNTQIQLKFSIQLHATDLLRRLQKFGSLHS